MDSCCYYLRKLKAATSFRAVKICRENLMKNSINSKCFISALKTGIENDKLQIDQDLLLENKIESGTNSAMENEISSSASNNYSKSAQLQRFSNLNASRDSQDCSSPQTITTGRTNFYNFYRTL